MTYIVSSGALNSTHSLKVTNQPISPDGWKIALVSPCYPSSLTDNNIHGHVL